MNDTLGHDDNDAPRKLEWALPNILRRADEHKARVRTRGAAKKAREQAADNEQRREGFHPPRGDGVGSTHGR